jgi:AraC-like DNA-binding protein
MFHYSTGKVLLLFLFPLILLGQVQKKNLARLSYDELYNLCSDNDNDRAKQIEYANTYLMKAKRENNLVQKAKGYYLYSFLYEETKAIRYLDSAIACSKKENDIKLPAYAYSEKAYVLQKQFNYKEAIDNFLLAEKRAQKNNTDFYYKVKFSIAVLRSEALGEVIEALALYKECFNYYKDKETRSSKYSFSYQLTTFALADAYKALHQTDSASYYNQLGYRESKITGNKNLNPLFVLNEGANQVEKKNYKEALDSIGKALPIMIALNDKGNILAAYYYLAKANDGLKNDTKAVKNFVKVDSMYNETGRITPEFMSGYPYLISYYKEKDDKKNQLKYITKYMDINKNLQKNYKELTKKLQKEYDIPHLISEKETLIQSLEDENAKSFWGIGGLILLSISVSGIGFYQYNLKKTYKSRFEKIINKQKEPNSVPADSNPKPTEIHTNKNKESVGIAEELVVQILEKLNHFESTNEYLQSTISLQLLAEKLETNSKYVSKIVNIYKEKTFIKYINDLRIDYAVLQIRDDKKLRNYTIQALALEFGFTSAESFSSAFFKNTGIKPTYYIEQLKTTLPNT